MRLKNKTVLYLLLGGVYTLTPAIIFGLLLGHQMPGYVIYPIDVMMVLCFSFIPFIIGFLGGEMYIDDMDESDPLYNPDMRKKNR
jgi:hypothetical protein